MKVNKLVSRTIDYTYYVFKGPLHELIPTLKQNGFIPLKSSYIGNKGELKLVIEATTSKIWVVAKMNDSLFVLLPSDIKAVKNASSDEKRIIIRRAVTSAYTKWVNKELDYQVVLNGTKPINTIECPWF